MPKRQSDEEALGVKTEGVDLAPPLKKQKTAGASSGRPKAAKKVWEEEEMTALWKAIYGLVKENIPGLMQNPELKPFGRSSANLHCKVDQVFASLTGKKR
ncbi:hypothetical protein FFLO_06507 [Filobasidium floriforme]|uniref:Uncharacterized protein n=1 Tax=Filobasidium floriforme TaxID=5210 RepID=A0A8K0JFA1_9TREE|nr:hypothetical protein FFLO_06507 [Filobasidium floriforme]